MSTKFPHSLLGYDPSHVERKINQLKHEHEIKTQGLKKELLSTIETVRNLSDELQKLKLELEQYKNSENQIGKILLTTHLETSEKIFDVINKVEKDAKETNELVIQREIEHTELKKVLTELKEQIHSLAQEYNLA
jgi:hypothetical protein